MATTKKARRLLVGLPFRTPGKLEVPHSSNHLWCCLLTNDALAYQVGLPPCGGVLYVWSLAKKLARTRSIHCRDFVSFAKRYVDVDETGMF